MDPTYVEAGAVRPPLPRSRRARLLGLAAAVAVSAVSIWASARLFTREAPAAASPVTGITVSGDGLSLAPSAPQWKVLKIGTVAPARPRLTDPLPARVKIDETRAARVGAPLAGRVTQVFVELGDRVKKGTPLFAVASHDLANLRADEARTEVDLAAARTTLERVRAMVAAKAVPAKEELAAQQAARQAELAHDLTRSKLAALKVASRAGGNAFTVTAPREGVIVEKNVLPAQEITPDGSQTLMMVADLGSVWVLADLPEADAMEVRAGAKAVVSSPSMPTLAIDGQVENVSAVVDPDRHTIPIRIRIDNGPRPLRPNMFAEVRFMVEPPPGAVEIPGSAVVSDGAKQSVFVQESPGNFARREITARSMRDGRVPVLAGLKAGEQIVERGALLLDNHLVLSR
jgi:RND family efflux transporter MFP subunit